MKLQDIPKASGILYTILVSSEQQALSYVEAINRHFGVSLTYHGGGYTYNRIREASGKLWFRLGG